MSCKKVVRKVMLKADEKHMRQIIAYLYQDVFDFPPRKEWKDFVNLVASYFELTKGQKQKTPSLKENFMMEKGAVLFMKNCAPLIPVEAKAKL
eukprot:1783967-Ditylum_brightwellii.AAC.1